RLGGAARGENFFRRFPTELVRAHGQGLSDLAAGENLDRTLRALNEAVLAQQLGRDDGAAVEPGGDGVEIHDLVLDAERIVKATLRHAPMQRHLSAFEAALEFEPRPRFGALVAATGGLALARPLAAANSLLRVLGAARRPQIVQTHLILGHHEML